MGFPQHTTKVTGEVLEMQSIMENLPPADAFSRSAFERIIDQVTALLTVGISDGEGEVPIVGDSRTFPSKPDSDSGV